MREEKSALRAGARWRCGAVARAFGAARRYERAQRLARLGRGPLGEALPGLPGWTAMRDLPEVPESDLPGVVAA